MRADLNSGAHVIAPRSRNDRNGDLPAKWYRNKAGTVVHRETCARISGWAAPWWYAEDMTEAEVRVHIKRFSWIRADAHELTVNLLRQLRQNDDRQQSIRDGYNHSYEMREELHEIQLAAKARHIALAIEREERKGEWSAPARQELTYCGGLRRAARIARGYDFRPQGSAPSSSSLIEPFRLLSQENQ